MTIYTFGLAARGGRLTSIFGFSQMLNIAKPHGPVNFVGSASAQDVAHAVSEVPPGLGNKIVLAGYSLGAVAALSVAMGIPVPIDMLFLLVPPRSTVPANVKRCINHTIVGGWFISPGWSSGIVSRESTATEAFNYDYGSFLGLTHVTIQALPAVHRSFRAEIERLAR